MQLLAKRISIVFCAFFIYSCGGGGGSSPTPNFLQLTCGNGKLDANESCDDGNIDNSDGCNQSCALEVGQAICGNGVKENGECCDDGNMVSGDGCSSTCTLEGVNHPPSPPILAEQPATAVHWAPTRLYLSWQASVDPDAGDEVLYDVYFAEGAFEGSIAYKTDLRATHFIIQASTDKRDEYNPDHLGDTLNLAPNKRYTWKICAHDRLKRIACSEPRSFYTDDSVVGWWRFDENPAGSTCPGGQTGQTVCDYSGKNNHGTPHGSPAWLSPPDSNLLGGALQFDGVDDRVEINDFSINGQRNISITASIKVNGAPLLPPSGDGFSTIIGKELVAALSVHNLNGIPKVVWNMGNGTGWYFPSVPLTSNLPALGQNYRVVSTYNGMEGGLFTNGAVDVMGTPNSAGLLGTNTISPSIGSHHDQMNGQNQFFNGFVDEIIVYNNLFSQEQIMNDYLSIR